MGKTLRIEAYDKHIFSAYASWPTSPPRGGLVVIQEVFGVNEHIRAIVDRFAAQKSYIAVAPAIFDRLEPNVALEYSDRDLAHGRALRLALGWEKPFLDIEATRAHIADVGGKPKIGVVGFCWGGSLAWISACRLPFQAAVCYYGGQIAQFCNERPICPVMMHFGRHDPIIPTTDQKAIINAHPGLLYHFYNAAHGFNCDGREDFRSDCAAEAWSYTEVFLDRYIT